MLWRGEIISVRSEMKLPSRQVNLWSHAFELQMFYWHDETTGRVTAVASLQWRRNGCDGVSNHQPYDCLLNRLFRRRSKKTSKLCVSGLYAGNSPVTGEFTAQVASDAENVSIWWRHHVLALSHRDRINLHWIISTTLSISIPFSGSVMATFLPQKRTHATIHPKNYAHGSHFVHDDVIKWKHSPRYWPFVRGSHQPPVNSPHKGQSHGALIFSLICAPINGWLNNREAGDLRCHRAHYDVPVMWFFSCSGAYAPCLTLAMLHPVTVYRTVF